LELIIIKNVNNIVFAVRRRVNVKLGVGAAISEEELVELRNGRTAINVAEGDHPAIGTRILESLDQAFGLQKKSLFVL
jgi:hypothetical protein